MDRPRRYDLLAVGLIALVTLVGLILWPQLPSRMAIQWGVESPTTYVSKLRAILGTFALGVGSVIAVRLMPQSMTNTPGGENVTVLFLGIVFAWIEAITIAWNLGFTLNIGLALLPVLVLAGLLVLYSYLESPLQ